VRRCSAWNGSRAFLKYLVRCILLVTSADESRRQIVVCPPVYAAGLAVSPCGVTSPDERRRQIVVCPPVYATGLAISPCGAAPHREMAREYYVEILHMPSIGHLLSRDSS
jgi:hypothetical protein